jgi:hypothetical protein
MERRRLLVATASGKGQGSERDDSPACNDRGWKLLGGFGHGSRGNTTPGTNFSNGVNTPLAILPARTTVSLMNLIVILIVLMLLFGGGGFYLGGPMVGGGGFGLILLILLVLFFTGNLGRR